jgi:hypothetical protein
MIAAYEVSTAVVRRKSTVAGELEGLELAPTKKVGVRVRVAYSITQ